MYSLRIILVFCLCIVVGVYSSFWYNHAVLMTPPASRAGLPCTQHSSGMLDPEEAASIAAEIDDPRLDPAVIELPARSHQYYNTRLGAPNVWEVNIAPSLVQEATAIFKGAKLGEAHVGLGGARGVPIRSFEGDGARFAVVQPKVLMILHGARAAAVAACNTSFVLTYARRAGARTSTGFRSTMRQR